MRRIVGTVLSSLGHIQDGGGDPDHADPSDVREDTVYANGSLVGTLEVGYVVPDALPSTDYADALQVVYEYLVLPLTQYGDNPVYSLTSTRVHIGALPKNPPATACLVVRDGGPFGMKGGDSQLENARVQIDCYGTGDSLQSARQVARKVALHMKRAKNVRVTSGLIVGASWSGGGSEIWIPDGVRPFVPVYFRVSVTP